MVEVKFPDSYDSQSESPKTTANVYNKAPSPNDFYQSALYLKNEIRLIKQKVTKFEELDAGSLSLFTQKINQELDDLNYSQEQTNAQSIPHLDIADKIHQQFCKKLSNQPVLLLNLGFDDLSDILSEKSPDTENLEVFDKYFTEFSSKLHTINPREVASETKDNTGTWKLLKAAHVNQQTSFKVEDDIAEKNTEYSESNDSTVQFLKSISTSSSDSDTAVDKEVFNLPEIEFLDAPVPSSPGITLHKQRPKDNLNEQKHKNNAFPTLAKLPTIANSIFEVIQQSPHRPQEQTLSDDGPPSAMIDALLGDQSSMTTASHSSVSAEFQTVTTNEAVEIVSEDGTPIPSNYAGFGSKFEDRVSKDETNQIKTDYIADKFEVAEEIPSLCCPWITTFHR